MKLLIFSNFYWPQPGGTQAVVLELARGFSTWHKTRAGDEPIKVTVATQEERTWSEDAAQPFALVRAPSRSRLKQLIREADLVHIAGAALAPLVLCVLHGKKFVVEHHAFHAACPNGQFFYEPAPSLCSGHFMARRYGECLRCNRANMGLKNSAAQIPLSGIRRWLCNRAAVNILPTEWLGTILKLDRMQTIHHGIPAAPRFTQVASGSTTCFGFQGRLVTTKGIRVLLGAVRQLQKENRAFRLKIIGDGPELEKLKASVAQCGAKVEFLGYVPDHRLPEAMADVSAVVMPSLAGEVFGLVAAENMLQGRLVIVSDLGSLKEVVGETGLVFRNGDAADLAARMGEVMDQRPLAASLSANARLRAQQAFDLQIMIEHHINIYRSVLARETAR